MSSCLMRAKSIQNGGVDHLGKRLASAGQCNMVRRCNHTGQAGPVRMKRPGYRMVVQYCRGLICDTQGVHGILGQHKPRGGLGAKASDGKKGVSSPERASNAPSRTSPKLVRPSIQGSRVM